jgi:hypothetical protein
MASTITKAMKAAGVPAVDLVQLLLEGALEAAPPPPPASPKHASHGHSSSATPCSWSSLFM